MLAHRRSFAHLDGNGLDLVFGGEAGEQLAAHAVGFEPCSSQRGDEDREGLRSEIGKRPIAVLAHPEIDLRDRVDAERRDDVDEESELDAPPLDERHRVEHLAPTGVLAGERLDDLRVSGGKRCESNGRATSSVTRPPPGSPCDVRS